MDSEDIQTRLNSLNQSHPPRSIKERHVEIVYWFCQEGPGESELALRTRVGRVMGYGQISIFNQYDSIQSKLGISSLRHVPDEICRVLNENLANLPTIDHELSPGSDREYLPEIVRGPDFSELVWPPERSEEESPTDQLPEEEPDPTALDNYIAAIAALNAGMDGFEAGTVDDDALLTSLSLAINAFDALDDTAKNEMEESFTVLKNRVVELLRGEQPSPPPPSDGNGGNPRLLLAIIGIAIVIVLLLLIGSWAYDFVSERLSIGQGDETPTPILIVAPTAEEREVTRIVEVAAEPTIIIVTATPPPLPTDTLGPTSTPTNTSTPTPTNTPKPTATPFPLPFVDDFSQPSEDWEVISGDPVWVNGDLTVDGEAWLAVGDEKWTNYRVTLLGLQLPDLWRSTIEIGVRGLSTQYVVIYRYTGWAGVGRRATWFVVKDGEYTVVPNTEIAPGRLDSVTVEVVDNSYTSIIPAGETTRFFHNDHPYGKVFLRIVNATIGGIEITPIEE